VCVLVAGLAVGAAVHPAGGTAAVAAAIINTAAAAVAAAAAAAGSATAARGKVSGVVMVEVQQSRHTIDHTGQVVSAHTATQASPTRSQTGCSTALQGTLQCTCRTPPPLGSNRQRQGPGRCEGVRALALAAWSAPCTLAGATTGCWICGTIAILPAAQALYGTAATKARP
jgi:hypothetical protein